MSIAIVGSDSPQTNSGGSTTITATLAQATTAGNALIAVMFGRDCTSVSSVAGGGTWSQQAASNVQSLGLVAIWSTFNISGGVTAVTATFNSTPTSNNAGLDVIEVSGLSGTVDVTNTSNNSGVTSGSVTVTPTAGLNEIIVAANRVSNQDSDTVTGGFTGLTTIKSGWHMTGAYDIVGSTAGSYTPTWTWTNSAQYDTVIAAYTASVATSFPLIGAHFSPALPLEGTLLQRL